MKYNSNFQFNYVTIWHVTSYFPTLRVIIWCFSFKANTKMACTTMARTTMACTTMACTTHHTHIFKLSNRPTNALTHTPHTCLVKLLYLFFSLHSFFRVQVWANIFADRLTALASKYSGAHLLQKVSWD